MKRALILLAIVSLAGTVAAQDAGSCTPQLAYAALATNTTAKQRAWAVTFIGCTALPTFTVGTPGTLVLGTTRYAVTVDAFQEPNALFTSPTLRLLMKTSATAVDPVDDYYATNSAQFEYPMPDGTTKSWDLTMTEALNKKSQSLHVGPATSGDQNGNGAASSTGQSSAFRFQYSNLFSFMPRFGGTTSTATKESRLSGIQRDLSVKIDTTDQKTGFVDDNQIAAGAYLPRIRIAGFLAEGKIGPQIRYQRPVHSNDHNTDAILTAAGWLPMFQSLNLFGSKDMLASPLGLAVSYGYRSERTAATNTTSHGKVFEGNATYHLYLFDDYRVDFRATTTYSDMNDTPSTASKTQHAFTAQILYRPTPEAPFAAVVAFQNGSFGAVATKLRQYFVGVAMSRFSDSFNAKH